MKLLHVTVLLFSTFHSRQATRTRCSEIQKETLCYKNDIADGWEPNKQACAKWCYENFNCEGWSYDLEINHCYLGNSITCTDNDTVLYDNFVWGTWQCGKPDAQGCKCGIEFNSGNGITQHIVGGREINPVSKVLKS